MTFDPVALLGIIFIMAGAGAEAAALYRDYLVLKGRAHYTFDSTVDIEIAGIVAIIFGLLLAVLF